jgi:hypothetical protein
MTEVARGNMQIPSKTVYEVLKSRDVRCLYHANSVLNSCHFLRAGALLSHGAVEERGLCQTPQTSDEGDKKFGIWFDVFADSVDIHNRAKRANAYGPVLFVLDVELISKAYTGKVWVTKLNPTKWDGRKHEERWFVSATDLKHGFQKGTFDQMIVFRQCDGQLSIRECLREIILDDPHLATLPGINYYARAYRALKLAMTEGHVSAPISRRKCPSSCVCRNEYQYNRERSKALYVPRA